MFFAWRETIEAKKNDETLEKFSIWKHYLEMKKFKNYFNRTTELSERINQERNRHTVQRVFNALKFNKENEKFTRAKQ